MTLRTVARAWWPLALSWGLMGLEQPAIAAAIARLAEPKIQLAAYGGVVFPIALVIEAPVIMMLAASTELSRNLRSFASLRRFTHRMAAVLTLLHIGIAFTPVGHWVITALLEAPPAVVAPARIGLMIMTPWTWAIASRRFNQGVLIRFGRPGAVTRGTALRLVVSALVLGAGVASGRVSGIVVGCGALSIGVVVEGLYAAVAVRSIVRGPLALEPHAEPLSGRAFAAFYVPLALTPLITLVIQPVGSAAIGRMPETLSSLAVWPVVISLAFLLQSLGLAFNEVVVALAARPGADAALKRFAWLLVVSTTALMIVLSLTPLADLWMRRVAGLPVDLAAIASGALWIAIPIPACRAVQSWYQGKLVVARRTGPITEAVTVFFVVCVAVLAYGVTQRLRGLEVALAAFAVGRLVQTAWLAIRARRLDPAVSRPIPDPE